MSPENKKQKIINSFLKVRKKTEKIIENLNYEEMVIQTEDFVSPVKWHLGHTTWFFEYFILKKFKKNYKKYDSEFDYLFNSYYNIVGEFNKKFSRGSLVWPLVDNVIKYRKEIEEKIIELVNKEPLSRDLMFFISLGINHEQQHQELILMDILNIYSYCPRKTFFKKNTKINYKKQFIGDWQSPKSVISEFGASEKRFSFDNEKPLFKKEVPPFKIDLNFVTIGDWIEFIENKGYEEPKYWLSDGWDYIKMNKIKKPMYWLDNKYEYTLNGITRLNKNKPVSHINFYEAEAYSKFKKKRLPTEFELELFLKSNCIEGNFLESNIMTPISFTKLEVDKNIYGNLWCWTSSNHKPYRNYKAFKGDITEYNQKFMCNQFVLKGGSFATPKNHIRASYRNFYYPKDRWQFCGVRLAEDIF